MKTSTIDNFSLAGDHIQQATRALERIEWEQWEIDDEQLDRKMDALRDALERAKGRLSSAVHRCAHVNHNRKDR